MLQRIQEIRNCLNHKCYEGALALALTLPDICGQIAYPDDKVGKRYEKWFEDYIPADYFSTPVPDFEVRTFDGEMCYQLRCHFFHSGSIDIAIDEKSQIDVFEMDVSEGEQQLTGYLYRMSKKQRIIRIEVNYLCNCLCDRAEKFYYAWPDKSAFEAHKTGFVNNSTDHSAPQYTEETEA